MKSDVKIDGQKVEITRVFDAPRERVFAAWKSPDQLSRWSGCKETSKVECTMDFRVGGTFTQKLHMPGKGEYSISGVYDEIVEPEKISYRVNLGPATTRVTVEFFAQGSQTRMVLTQEGLPDPGLCKIVSQGTMESFDKLDRLLMTFAA